MPPRPIRVYDPIQQLAIIDDDVLERFHVDTIELGRGFALEDQHWADWTLPDGTPCQMPAWALPERQAKSMGAAVRRAAGCWPGCPTGPSTSSNAIGRIWTTTTWIGCRKPWTKTCGAPCGVRPARWLAGPDGDRVLAEGAGRLREQTDRAIIGLFGGNLLEIGQFLYRNDNFFMLLAGNPRRAHEFLDRLVEIHLANLERFLAAVGP